MSSFVEARIDLDAISGNIALLAERAAGAQVMGVVKADGYGHGMVPAARAALAGGATWLGTAFIAEALQLRAAGIDAPLLAWLVPPGEPLVEAIDAGIDLGIGSMWVIDEVIDAARHSRRQARIHLKVDTGMNRGGINPADWGDAAAVLARAEAEGLLTVTGVFSHLACADEPDNPATSAQLEAFHEALSVVAKAGLRPEVRHIANSAAVLTRPDARFDLVRPGIATYGLSPIPGLDVPGCAPQ